MQTAISFGEIIEAAGRLSLDEQESLLDILRRRVIENRRAELAQDIQNTREEFQKGGYQPAAPNEIIVIVHPPASRPPVHGGTFRAHPPREDDRTP